jgi:hypothetical protein
VSFSFEFALATGSFTALCDESRLSLPIAALTTAWKPPADCSSLPKAFWAAFNSLFRSTPDFSPLLTPDERLGDIEISLLPLLP